MIFLDLDGTLISSFGFDGPAAGPRDEVGMDDGTVRYTLLREGAFRMLRDMRSIGAVKLLTGAERSYAARMDSYYGLGFDADIISRESFDSGQIMSPMVFPVALVDDQTADSECVCNKLHFIGGGVGNLFQVVEYGGYPDRFTDQWPQLFESISQFLSAGPCEKRYIEKP